MTRKRRIQKIINFGARTVSGLNRRDHFSPTLEALGWPSVEEMVRDRDLAVVRRLLSGAAPPSLAACLSRRADVSARRTRGTAAGVLELPSIRTEAARRSFPYRSIVAWNDSMRN